MVCLLKAGLTDERTQFSRTAPPEKFGIYVIDRHDDGRAHELGRGSMGVTYRATDLSLNRKVALKIIRQDLVGNESGRRERFIGEARIAAGIRHPNVAAVYQFGVHEDTGECFYVMELVEGETLEQRVYRSGPLEAGQVIAIAQQVTDALAEAEQRGLIHRDLKPANVMLVETDDGRPAVRIIDFGLAKARNQVLDPMSLTHDEFVGTPAYASPEQFAQMPLNVRSDIYSLGITLWFALTGKTPFRGRTVEELRHAQTSGALPLEELKAARVPRRLIAILQAMLAHEAAARPNVIALCRMLEGCLRKGSAVRRRLAFAALLLAVTGAAWAFARSSPVAKPITVSAKSVAVLPFEDLTGEQPHPVFASAIHEDLLAALSRIADLRVISRNSVMQYRGIARDLREIARALDVSAVLEGNVYRSGDRARINVQLINAADGAQIWSENYDRNTAEAFAVAGEAAVRIAGALKAKLSAAENARITTLPTQNREAYLRFVEAKDIYLDYRKLEPDLARAEKLLQEAVALDSHFALAYARLSEVESTYYEMYDKTPARRAEAVAAAVESLRLDPDLPEGHVALGLDYWRSNARAGEIDYEKTLHEFALAEKRLPNDPEVATFLARVERHQGKWPESTAHLRKSVALDPRSVEAWHRLFSNYQLTKNFAAAEDALDHVFALAPAEDRWTYQEQRAWLHMLWHGDLTDLKKLTPPPANDLKGLRTQELFADAVLLRDYGAAEEALLRDLHETFSDESVKESYMGQLASYRGQPAQARKYYESARIVLERAAVANPRQAQIHAHLGQAYAGLGRSEDALREARVATEILSESKDAWFGVDMLTELAATYAMLGQVEQAIPLLEHSLRTPGGVFRNELRFDPCWDPLRTDARFNELIAKPDVIVPEVVEPGPLIGNR
jgi:serine/threonine protein kinase/Flp pilus assembly protein TadD